MRSLKAKINLTLGCLASLALLLVFQNCAQKFGFDAVTPNASAFSATTFLTINGGALFTRDAGVKVQTKAPLADEMYLTNDPSCETGGVWESIKTERPWVLPVLNSQATVFAKFKASSGAVLPCVSASIIHDDIAPKVSFVKVPDAIVNVTDALHSFGADDQSGSGLDHYECKVNGAADFAPCASTNSLRNLGEGQQRLLVRAVDRAGNVSDPVENGWLIDLTGPQISFTERPASLSNKSSAIFRFEATDALSGVANISCRLLADGVQVSVSANCTSPTSFSSLGAENKAINYTFSLSATDKAGNPSLSVPSYDFVIDKAPSGAFDVIGLSGGDDVNPDQWLGTTPIPTVTWTQSAGATTYYVSILNSAGSQVVCAEAPVAAPGISFAFPASCALSDGVSYKAHVRAVNSLGNVREAALFAFTVDLTPPVVTITGPTLTNDDKNAAFNFTMTDASGIASATCTRTLVGAAAGTEVTANCKDLTAMAYTNLTVGASYTFKVAASDKAGNKMVTAPVTWRVNQVVCDPFDAIDQTCVKGLRANLYYLTGTQQGTLKTVDEYIAKGTQANVTIYMSQLIVPSQAWTSGFSTTDGSVVKDNSGTVLKEYFALDLQTFVKLDPANNAAGKYQFAILSDDGAVVQTRTSATSPWTTLIDSDGDHSTRMGCDANGVTFSASTRLNMRVKYYQGPRTHIALTLLWRPMPTAAADQVDAECGQSGDPYFYGDVVNNPPNYKDYAYGKLVTRGWKPLSPANFVSDVTAPAATPTPTPTPTPKP